MSKPVNNIIPTEINRGWYCCVGEYCEGPFETREMALMKAREKFCEYDEGLIDLMEGCRPSLRASDFIHTNDISGLLESISEAASEEHGYDDVILFDCTDEQEKELFALVKKAVDEWQSKNSIVVYSNIIKAITTKETVLPDGVVKNEVGNSEQDGKFVEEGAGNE